MHVIVGYCDVSQQSQRYFSGATEVQAQQCRMGCTRDCQGHNEGE